MIPSRRADPPPILLILIDHFMTTYHLSDVWNTARLIRVLEIKP